MYDGASAAVPAPTKPATAGAAVAIPFAEPISQALIGHADAGLARIAIFGLWIQTLFEYLATLLRVDERAKAYFVFNMAGVLMAIPLTVWLVVIEEQGGIISYWALALPEGKPDFHAPACFIAELPAAQGA